MGHIKARVLSLLKTKAALIELGKLGVDVDDDLSGCEEQITLLVKRLKMVEPVAYYRRRKQWRAGLTAKQKDTIKAMLKHGSDDDIAEELVA